MSRPIVRTAGALVVLASLASCSSGGPSAAPPGSKAALGSPLPIASATASSTVTTGLPSAEAASQAASSSVSPTADPSSGPVVAGTPVPLYLVDANTNNTLGQQFPPGVLEGVKGIIPGGEIPAAFKERLQSIDPGLQSYSYAAEAYDAVVLAALGAAVAKSDAGVDVGKQLVPITHGAQACTEYASCLALVKQGMTIDYSGVSGPIDFSPSGDPTKATLGIYQFDADNQLLPDVTYQQGEIQPDANAVPIDGVVQKGAGDRVFRIAAFLPSTGSLASLGPPELAAVRLAVQDIQSAGGVPGFDSVALIEGDSGDTSTGVGAKSIKGLLAQHPDVLIGAASSSSTMAVLDQVTRAGVLMISPANTLPSLTTVPDHGLYWRTSPSDVLEGAFVGWLVVQDGHPRVAILARKDAYGQSLEGSVTRAVGSVGGEVVTAIEYDGNATDFRKQVAALKAAKPDAIVLLGADESAQIIAELVKQGIGPNAVG